MKHRRFALMTAAALALTTSTASAHPSVVTGGFVLTGTDAAYANFLAPVDACHTLDLFVGYVAADRLLNPLGSGAPFVHSDVDVTLRIYENAETEGCGSADLHLAGGEQASTGQVEMVMLESATLDGFELEVTGVEGGVPVTVMLTLDLEWTGDGDIFTETFHEPGTVSANRTVLASVDATVTIDSVDGGGELAAALADGPDVYSTGDGLEQTRGVITHGQGIVINLPEHR
jgi:hypothetical protein